MDNAKSWEFSKEMEVFYKYNIKDGELSMALYQCGTMVLQPNSPLLHWEDVKHIGLGPILNDGRPFYTEERTHK